jgi:patatin-like phospholipase/acyl hydrolase
MATTRVLALDGGGIRGVVSVVLLQRLAAEPALAGWLGRTDVYAGTSTGGLIALGLARGLPLATLRALYEQKGKQIFADSLLDDILDLGKIAGADYSSKNLAKELKAAYGETTTLGQLGSKVVIPTFDLDNKDDLDALVAAGKLTADEAKAQRTWKPKVFHNFPGADADDDALAWRVGMATSAAPTYFPAFDGYVDGGVFANNPSLVALAQTQDERATGACPGLDEIVLLSLGTGTSLCWIQGKNLDWGYAQWAKPLVEVMLEGVAGIADYQCQRLLGEKYHRLAPVFPPGTRYALDDVARVPDMVKFASDPQQVDLTDTIAFLKNEWM